MEDEKKPEASAGAAAPAPETEAKTSQQPQAAPPRVEPTSAGKPEAAPASAQPSAKELLEGDEGASQSKTVAGRRRSKSGKVVPVGIVFIKASFNNTIVSITDVQGNVVAWSSAGRGGFKGSRKSTAFAATVVSQEAARQAVAMGMHEVEVRVQGPGAGRESAIRALQSAGLSLSSIKDVTPVPHNGCRPRKRRRV